MKLQKYEDKSKKKRKIMLISLGVIVLIGVSLLLYKTFASFTESAEFPMMNGKVDYFGNSDIYFVFYQGDKELEEMPQKDNEENLVFDHGECDNGASIVWDENEWAPLVKGLNKVKTKCSLYFKKQLYVRLGGMKVPIVESGDGLYEVKHNNLTELNSDWNGIEYRYAGVNPNNYVKFNNEIWRIIGLVNVKVNSTIVAQNQLKIVRQDGIEDQKNFGSYAWDRRASGVSLNWTTSKLKDMLNGIYYESGTGDCYDANSNGSANQCDFNSGTNLPKGLDETARNMIYKDFIWNIGGWDSILTVSQFYEKERGAITPNGNQYPSEWSSTTDVGGKHNGIGLIYPTDYAYATNGGSIGRETCFAKSLESWNNTSGNYQSECGGMDWLRPNSNPLWTLTPHTYSYAMNAFTVTPSGNIHSDNVSTTFDIWPVVYLDSSIKIINGYGTIEEPYILQIAS